MSQKMILPDDVLGIINDFAKPIWTRKDWRFCGYRESNLIMRYYEWQNFLYYDVQWNPLYAWDGESIARFVKNTKLIRSLILYENRYAYMFSMEEIFRRLLQELRFDELFLPDLAGFTGN
jgi:hypothetical protein